VLARLVSGIKSPSPYADALPQSTAEATQRVAIMENLERIKQKQHIGEVLDAVTVAKYFVPQESATARQSTSINHSVPAAPHGGIPVNTSMQPDAITGHKFVRLFEGPAILTKPLSLKEGSTDGPRTLQHVPSFAGTGATFAFWHKHTSNFACLEASNEYCAVDLLNARDDDGVCWSFRILEDRFFYRNPKGVDFNFKYTTPFELAEHNLNAATKPVWRHIAITLDPSHDSISFYLDGRFNWQGPWGSSVAEADCATPSRSVGLGRSRPRWTFGLDVGVYDMRMYPGVVLSSTEVNKLATAADVLVFGSQDLCVDTLSSVSYHDKVWKDEHNRGCDWYQLHRQEAPTICTLPEPTLHCPIACGSRQSCFFPGVQLCA
jgi:hypothetical protein